MHVAGVGWGGEISKGFVGHGNGSGPGRAWGVGKGVPWSEYCADRLSALTCCVRTDCGGQGQKQGAPSWRAGVGGWGGATVTLQGVGHGPGRGKEGPIWKNLQ